MMITGLPPSCQLNVVLYRANNIFVCNKNETKLSINIIYKLRMMKMIVGVKNTAIFNVYIGTDSFFQL